MFFCGFNIVAVILAWVSEVSGDFIAAAAQLADEMITASYNAQQIPLFDSWRRQIAITASMVFLL